jgi:hypothetical protein
MSSARYLCFTHETNEQIFTKIMLEFTPNNQVELINKFKSIFKHKHSTQGWINTYKILEEKNAFVVACQQLRLNTAKEKEELQFVLELYKLTIQQAIRKKFLAETTDLEKNNASQYAYESVEPRWKKYLKEVAYWAVILIATVIATLQGMDSIIGILELLGKTVAISSLSLSMAAIPLIVLLTLGAFFACALYSAFEIETFKEKLGITSKKALGNIIGIYEKQIEVAQAFENDFLIQSDEINNPQKLAYYLQLTALVNRHITIKLKPIIKKYQEHPLRKLTRYATLGAGMLLAAGDIVYALMGIIGGAALLSTIATISCSILGAVAAVLFFLSYEDKVNQLINSPAQQINHTHKKVKEYCKNNLLGQIRKRGKYLILRPFTSSSLPPAKLSESSHNKTRFFPRSQSSPAFFAHSTFTSETDHAFSQKSSYKKTPP